MRRRVRGVVGLVAWRYRTEMPRGGAATSVEATLSRYEFEFARDEFIDKLSFIVDKGIQSGRLLP